MSPWFATTVFASMVAAWHAAPTTEPINPRAGFLCELATDMSPAAVNRRRLDAVAMAAAVFSGRVVEVDRVTVRFQVETLWKGDPSQRVDSRDRHAEDPNIWVEDVYPFVLDTKYLVYAHLRRGALTTDACSRTMPVADAADEIRGLDRILPRRDMK
jgi:hypothetical protein